MAESKRSGGPIPDDLRRSLSAVHRGLLDVHKALLDHERARYERVRGRINGPGEFLQLVINDPWFAWLRPISELAVQIDEFTDAKDPPPPGTGEALLAQAQRLLAPDETGGDFQRQYHRAIQESPDVAARHGQWRAATGRE